MFVSILDVVVDADGCLCDAQCTARVYWRLLVRMRVCTKSHAKDTSLKIACKPHLRFIQLLQYLGTGAQLTLAEIPPESFVSFSTNYGQAPS